MTISASQSLDQLRARAEPAWLWDAARGRVVWANAAGVAAFECQSLFDLIDRPFDLREEGVARVSAIAARLKSDEALPLELSFPSTGRVKPFQCVARLHPLADGRVGVLVFEGDESLSQQPSVTQTTDYTAYDYLPVPVAVIAEPGNILHTNALVAELVAASTLGDFRNLLAEPTRATLLLQRLQNSELVSSVERINGRHGLREVRLTLRRLPGDSKAYAVITLEDVTERRLIERTLPPVTVTTSAAPIQKTTHIRLLPLEEFAPGELPLPAPAQGEARATAFVEIGKQLTASIATSKNLDAGLKSKKDSGNNTVPVPNAVRTSLDNAPDALLIVQDGKPHFANTKLLALLKARSLGEICSDAKFVAGFAADAVASQMAFGGQVFEVVRKSVPWLAGPADQFTFKLSAQASASPNYVITFSKAEKIEFPPVPLLPLPAAGPRENEPIEKGFLDTLSESDIRHLLNMASDSSFVLDENGNVLDSSLGASKLFGAVDTLQELLTPESRRVLRERMQQFGVVEGPAKQIDGFDLQCTTQDQRQIPMIAVLCQLKDDAAGKRFGLVLRDVSTRRALEDKLEDANIHAAETRQTSTDFLARVNHELRTPLNAILGFSEVMQQERLGPLGNSKYQSYVKDIRDSGNYLLSIVNDLLELSRIEAGKLELNFTAVDLGEVVDYCMRMLAEDARKGSVTLRKEIAESSPHVVADLRAMRQIFMNLISNAVKYTNTGGEVVVSAGINAAGEMVFSVTDTGIGMDEHEVVVALEPFGRNSLEGRIDDREVKGTGLGLPLTQALVKANRAQFNLESETDKGTRATITFPTTRVLAD